MTLEGRDGKQDPKPSAVKANTTSDVANPAKSKPKTPAKKPTAKTAGITKGPGKLSGATKTSAKSTAPIKRDQWIWYTHRFSPPTPKVKDGVTEAPEKAIARKLGIILDRIAELTEQDIALAKWNGSETDAPISLTNGTFQEQLLKVSYSQLRSHAHRLRLDLTKDIWVDVRIGVNAEPQDFLNDFRQPLESQHNAYFYTKKLQQSEYSASLGWLLCTSDEVDPTRLEQTLGEILKTPVEVKVKKVNKPRGAPDFHPTPMAFHVCVDREQSSSGRKTLEQLYSSSNTKKPLGSKCRLIPEYSQCISTAERDIVDRAVMRQNAYVNKMVKDVSPDIQALDTINPVSEKTLRQMILDMRRHDKPSSPLFMDVGDRKKFRFGNAGGGTVFLCHPEVEMEARSIRACLYSYLRHKYSDSVDRFFQPSHVTEYADATWDPEKRTAITARMLDLDAGFEIPGYDFENLEDVVVPNQPQTDVEGGPKPPTSSKSAVDQAMFGQGGQDHDTMASLRDVRKGSKGRLPPPTGEDDSSNDRTT